MDQNLDTLAHIQAIAEHLFPKKKPKKRAKQTTQTTSPSSSCPVVVLVIEKQKNHLLVPDAILDQKGKPLSKKPKRKYHLAKHDVALRQLAQKATLVFQNQAVMTKQRDCWLSREERIDFWRARIVNFVSPPATAKPRVPEHP